MYVKDVRALAFCWAWTSYERGTSTTSTVTARIKRDRDIIVSPLKRSLYGRGSETVTPPPPFGAERARPSAAEGSVPFQHEGSRIRRMAGVPVWPLLVMRHPRGTPVTVPARVVCYPSRFPARRLSKSSKRRGYVRFWRDHAPPRSLAKRRSGRARSPSAAGL